MTKNSGIIVLLLGLTLGSCDDSGFSTGLPPNKSLGSLNPGEASQLCKSTKNYIDGKARTTACQFTALAAGLTQGKTDADARMICKKQLDQCLATPAKGSGTTSGGGTATVDCQPPPASCMATVGEYETCLNDVSAGYDKALASIPSCDTVTFSPNGLSMIMPSTPTTPASCNTVTSKCAGISIGGASTGSGGKI
ncbi:MAG TPA: hypothetical protein VNO55_28915 [Polyangia bacterium]|nr:hypothetical protein [Polyangia bacterium]